MEQAIISGVTHDTSEAKVTIAQVADRPGVAASLFRALADEAVNVDMIVQNVSTDGHTDISFTVPKDDLHRGLAVMEKVAAEIEATGVTHDAAVARVTLVGAGMKTNPGVAAKMFEVLSNEGVNIEMISTSSIRISCVVQESDVEAKTHNPKVRAHRSRAPFPTPEPGPERPATKSQKRESRAGRSIPSAEPMFREGLQS